MPHTTTSNATPTAPAVTRPRILVVDDHAATCEIIKHILRSEYDVVAVGDGQVAWDYVQSDVTVQAVITDINLPGMDGIELMRNIRGHADAHIKKLPLIAITGAHDKELQRRAYTGGVTGFISKPIDIEQLRSLMHAYVHPDAVAPAAAPPVAVEATPEPVPESKPVRETSNVIEFPQASVAAPASAAPATVSEPSATEPVATVKADDEIGAPSDEDEMVLAAALAAAAPAVEPAPIVEPVKETLPVEDDPLAGLSIEDLEAMIKDDTASARRNMPPKAAKSKKSAAALKPAAAPKQDALPSELLSVDNALWLVTHGQAHEVTPHLDQLRQLLEPLLKYHREHDSAPAAR